MKITVETTVTIEKANGEKTVMACTKISDHGDNPSFRRVETQRAVGEAAEDFKARHHLAGTTDL